jgi:hypothetical protein
MSSIYDVSKVSHMDLRCFSATLAMLMGFGLSAPVAAQSVEQAQASSDAHTPKTDELLSEWQLKPRWSVQYDVASIDGPDGLAGVGNFQDFLNLRQNVSYDDRRCRTLESLQAQRRNDDVVFREIQRPSGVQSSPIFQEPMYQDIAKQQRIARLKQEVAMLLNKNY